MFIFAAVHSHSSGAEWPRAAPDEVGLDEKKLREARDYALTGGGAGVVVRHGTVAMTWGDQQRRYDLKSTTKSIGVTALGVAIQDSKIALSDLAIKHHPTFGVPPESNAKTGWLDRITILHLATQTAGFEKPGGYTKLIFEPGAKWSYSDGGPNWLAECVTLVYRRDVRDLMFERVFTPLGITDKDLTWRNNSYRPAMIDGIPRREFGSGISANVDAMARIGQLYLNRGAWNDQQIVPAEFVDAVRGTAESVVGLPEVDPKNYGNASDHYGLLWWNNADGTLKHVPRDAYWSWGLYDSLIVVIPSLDVVVARAGQSWKRPTDWDGHYDVLQPFLDPICAAEHDESELRHEQTERQSASEVETTADIAPYPRSSVIKRIEWAPLSSIIRLAKGSDNWPLTWGDDDRLYTAYGDGRGFEPFVDRKLSLGLSFITGSPPDIVGKNLRAASGEQAGDGATGKKASGMLMVDGVLYMWVRNAGNSQLAWSNDQGRSWTWSNWRMTTSFGCPTFLNFGQNYAGARDEYVYVYSHDSDSAYKPADDTVLARVPKDRIIEGSAYEFFSGLDDCGEPHWTTNVAHRRAVITHPGKCYRTTASYHPKLERYLLCQINGGGDTRFEGGFGIYEAPEPWGPWSTVYFTRRWDVGPGETASIPTKWIDEGGTGFYLVFSGDDCFSVRRANAITMGR